MATAAVLKRQRGRPLKKVPKGERTQIGVIVGGKTKALLLKAMQESGRTISREAEYLIEKALAYDSVLASMKRTLKEVEKDNVEAALWRKGYRPFRPLIKDKDGKLLTKEDGRPWTLWAEPGCPGFESSGFIP
jgi:dissimilatory sulfite reductase (desulfoviridin) alpha/beta subunit